MTSTTGSNMGSYEKVESKRDLRKSKLHDGVSWEVSIKTQIRMRDVSKYVSEVETSVVGALARHTGGYSRLLRGAC